ncbi:hypothetical protein CU669_19980 [Paramagnetospirillum kuznetsovii]|uniref:protein O-GlcNAc transferase n=1 Tax=Paramagnetospirillum kuznetsovii TaxID=2053833 RepID=A0A364NSX2_9PROT|nr:tetratricopeptide repeat protein [Paramagnetospirillum kuznetsovii]RAU20132.1 hypothetical protein CU669_19980 [Paramagnetospirillum kuznetsovii]
MNRKQRRAQAKTGASPVSALGDDLNGLFQLALGHHQAGRLAEAEALYHRILAKEPRHVDALHLLGLVAHQCGNNESAVQLITRAIGLNPGFAEAHNNLGNALRALGRPEEAVAAYDAALYRNPRLVEAHLNKGLALHELGRLDQALASFDAALQLCPDQAEAHYNRGVILHDLGLYQDAVGAYDIALMRHPGRVEAQFNRGVSLQALGEDDLALAAFDAALAAKPDYLDAHINRGAVLKAKGRQDQAAEAFATACRLGPDRVEGFTNLGMALNDLGRRGEAMDSFGRALAIKPDYDAAHRALLATLLYGSDLSPQDRFAIHRAFETACYPVPPPSPGVFANPRDPERRLRIGLVSSDFLEHPVGRNMLPLLEAHDQNRVGLHFYAHLDKPDAMTERFRAVSEGWRSIRAMGDEEVACQIRDDGIDVLIHLAGRFDLNRPRIAMFRPAPVQISFHDAATSGLAAMDAIIADRVMVPRRPTELFTERPIRLPSFYLHAPLDNAPPVAPPPLLTKGVPTFGSFNNPAKLSEATLATWALVLKRIPGARLVLKYKNWFANPSVAQRVLGIMAAQGIDPTRISLGDGEEDANSHLARYGGIDVALDPFPFNGSTTTFEALWMGVPVVTLLGETMVGRWAAGILNPIGLGALVAHSVDEYVELCRALCAEPDNLARLRSELRQRVAASPLCNARLKARHLERTYRALWRRWCKKT